VYQKKYLLQAATSTGLIAEPPYGQAFRGVRRNPCSAYEIERRPRGASRMNPLLHLLQRGHA